jgi:hypothetical protein
VTVGSLEGCSDRVACASQVDDSVSALPMLIGSSQLLTAEFT